MAKHTIEVKCRIVGREDGLDSVLLDIATERIIVAELIRRTVEEQISTMLLNKQMEREAVQRALARQYLTQEEIDTQARQGSVRVPSRLPSAVPEIDPGLEVQRALDAFTRHKFYIFIQDRQVNSLEEELSFTEQNSVTFLRLMPLVGG